MGFEQTDQSSRRIEKNLLGKNLRKKKKYLTTYISTDIIRLLGTIVTSFTPQHEHFVTEFLYHRQFLVLSSYSTFANPTPNKTQISCNFDFDRNGKCSSSRLHLPLSPKRNSFLSLNIFSNKKQPFFNILLLQRGDGESERERRYWERHLRNLKIINHKSWFLKTPKKKKLLLIYFFKKRRV